MKKQIKCKPIFPKDFPESIKEDTTEYSFEIECEKNPNEEGEFAITLYSRYNDTSDYDSVFFLSEEDARSLAHILLDASAKSKNNHTHFVYKTNFFKDLEREINTKNVESISIIAEHTGDEKSTEYTLNIKYSLKVKDGFYISNFIDIDVDMSSDFNSMARNIIKNKREEDLSFISATTKKVEDFATVVERQFIMKLLLEMEIDIDSYSNDEFEQLFDFHMSNIDWDFTKNAFRELITTIKENQNDILKNFDKVLSGKDEETTIHFSKPIPNEKITREDFNSILNGFKEECLSKEDSK